MKFVLASILLGQRRNHVPLLYQRSKLQERNQNFWSNRHDDNAWRTSVYRIDITTSDAKASLIISTTHNDNEARQPMYQCTEEALPKQWRNYMTKNWTAPNARARVCRKAETESPHYWQIYNLSGLPFLQLGLIRDRIKLPATTTLSIYDAPRYDLQKSKTNFTVVLSYYIIWMSKRWDAFRSTRKKPSLGVGSAEQWTSQIARILV